MPVASDPARAITILASLLWAAGVAGARQCRVELGLDHRLDELAHPIAQADFDRIKPIVEKMDRRLGLRLQGCRVRAIAGHGVVSTGAQTPGLLGFQHPETTPPSIPTTPRTAPTSRSHCRAAYRRCPVDGAPTSERGGIKVGPVNSADFLLVAQCYDGYSRSARM